MERFEIFEAEIEREEKRRGLAQIADRASASRQMETDRHLTLHEHAMRLGRKATRFSRTIDYDHEAHKVTNGALVSRVGGLPDATHARILYRPPLRVEGKNLGFDETTIQVRQCDAGSGVDSEYHELAKFTRAGWIYYTDLSVYPPRERTIEAGDEAIPDIEAIVRVLETSKFTIPE